MSVSLDLSRSNCIKAIGDEEIKQIIRVSIEHFAIPIIAGISMDEVSQQEFEAMGGKGLKPSPLSAEVKLEIYSRMQKFIKPKIVNETVKLVNSVLEQSLSTFSDEELRLRVAALNEKIVEAEPNWKILPDLFRDHICLFKELQKSTNLKVNLVDLHEKLCPIMCQYRDSGELFGRINLDELL